MLIIFGFLNYRSSTCEDANLEEGNGSSTEDEDEQVGDDIGL